MRSNRGPRRMLTDRETGDTFYNWRSKYGGMEVADVKRLRALEAENALSLGLKLNHPMGAGQEQPFILRCRLCRRQSLCHVGSAASKSVFKAVLSCKISPSPRHINKVVARDVQFRHFSGKTRAVPNWAVPSSS